MRNLIEAIQMARNWLKYEKGDWQAAFIRWRSGRAFAEMSRFAKIEKFNNWDHVAFDFAEQGFKVTGGALRRWICGEVKRRTAIKVRWFPAGEAVRFLLNPEAYPARRAWLLDLATRLPIHEIAPSVPPEVPINEVYNLLRRMVL